MNEIQINQFTEALLNEQAELLGVADFLDDLQDSVRLNPSLIDQTSKVNAMQHRAMVIDDQERQQSKLTRITEALHRIDEGTFGECVHCLGVIPLELLENDPLLEHCGNCVAEQV